jgi:hypothetical protein
MSEDAEELARLRRMEEAVITAVYMLDARGETRAEIDRFVTKIRRALEAE